MTNIIRLIKFKWGYFKIVILGMKPDWLRYHEEESSSSMSDSICGDLLLIKTETVWVVDCNSYFEFTDDGV